MSTIDNSNYITPYETALAVVATAMKKARLQIDTLVVNSVVGGILFSCGGMLYLAAHADNPELFRDNVGILNYISGITYGIGLFYVVIMGADLFNSNILFFSVGFLRRAVSIYDLAISWLVSWLGNIAGSLFVAYIFGQLAGIGKQSLWRSVSRSIAEEKLSYSFIEIFLKGIAGNFLVSLAIYLQLMAKPLHVKLFLIILPIFTFISIGYTHTVGDMVPIFIGLFNGADFPVKKYLWKLLVPASVGNIIGGCAFGLVIPFYLHLVVVERDRKKLSLPEFKAEDEQPELNMDSRVVRVGPALNETSLEEAESSRNEHTEDMSLSPANSISSSDTSSERSSYSTATVRPLTREHRMQMISPRRTLRRSPPGVFPVKGMGEPLSKEKSIANGNYSFPSMPDVFSSGNSIGKRKSVMAGMLWRMPKTGDDNSSSASIRRVKTVQAAERANCYRRGGYDVVDNKPGSRLRRVLSGLTVDRQSTTGLPRTVQTTTPDNDPSRAQVYNNRSSNSDDLEQLQRRATSLGVTPVAMMAANNVAGIDNYTILDWQRTAPSATTPTPTPTTTKIRSADSAQRQPQR